MDGSDGSLSGRGQGRAEILEASTGQPIPGCGRDESVPAVVDELDTALRWDNKPDISELRGKTVRFRFWILRAQLYAFWFAG